MIKRSCIMKIKVAPATKRKLEDVFLTPFRTGNNMGLDVTLNDSVEVQIGEVFTKGLDLLANKVNGLYLNTLKQQRATIDRTIQSLEGSGTNNQQIALIPAKQPRTKKLSRRLPIASTQQVTDLLNVYERNGGKRVFGTVRQFAKNNGFDDGAFYTYISKNGLKERLGVGNPLDGFKGRRVAVATA